MFLPVPLLASGVLAILSDEEEPEIDVGDLIRRAALTQDSGLFWRCFPKEQRLIVLRDVVIPLFSGDTLTLEQKGSLVKGIFFQIGEYVPLYMMPQVDILSLARLIRENLVVRGGPPRLDVESRCANVDGGIFFFGEEICHFEDVPLWRVGILKKNPQQDVDGDWLSSTWHKENPRGGFRAKASSFNSEIRFLLHDFFEFSNRQIEALPE